MRTIHSTGCPPVLQKTFWLPPGKWLEKETGQLLDGGSSGKTITKNFDMTEIPVYVKAGAVVRPSLVGGISAAMELSLLC